MDDTTDQLRAMLLREEVHYPVFETYLFSEDAESQDSDHVTESWRCRICEWIFEVVDHFGFDREVVSIALDYLDRSASVARQGSGKYLSKREFQLFAVTSLYIAIKLHGETDPTEGSRLKLKISAFQDLSRGFFEVGTIEDMEIQILQLLKWRVNPTTPSQFIACILRLLPVWQTNECNLSYEDVTSRIFDVARYLTELATFDSTFTFNYKPSVLALASILCAIESLIDSIPLPNYVQLRFIQSISATESLSPDEESVFKVQAMLRALAPTLFTKSKASSGMTRVVSLLDIEDNGQEFPDSVSFSPVSVCTESESRRKRLRTGEP